ncbi:MAG: carbohydrate-binding family 9-like protein, partial [Leeuwenhoekiella sp.]
MRIISCESKSKIACLAFVLGGFILQAQEVPRSYVAHKITDSLTIDGKGDEHAWQQAEWTDKFIDIEGVKKPVYDTQIKMLWDDKYLYFLASLKEPDVWATLKQRDTIIFYNNDFEIFIDPDGDTHNYYEFEMNALNTVWDLFLTKPYRNEGKVLDSWDIQGLKTATSIDGSLNNSTDKDKGWTAEIA